MKKKQLIFLLSFLIVISILGLLSFYLFKIDFIKNIKSSKLLKSVEDNITTIDVTGLIIGQETQHEHIYKTMYNNSKHWEECTVCPAKRNEVNHTYTDNGWTYGTKDNCKSDNVHTFSCKCGHSYTNATGRKSHTSRASNYDVILFMCYSDCTICKEKLSYHFCVDSSGNRIGCTNLKKCKICGNQAKFNNHVMGNFIIGDSDDIVGGIIPNEDTSLKCKNCNTSFCNVSINHNYVEQISDNVFKFYVSITTPESALFSKVDGTYNAFGTSATLSNISVNNTIQRNIWDYEATITFNKHIETSSIVGFRSYITINGYPTYIWLFSKPFNADTIAPLIDTVNLSNSNEWSKKKNITVSGSENYCNSVSVQILDDTGKIVYTGSTNVANKKYSITCIPDIEANDIGRKFTVIVADTCNNSVQKDFNISKIDSVAPNPISSTVIGGDWAKEKDFTFTAIDHGIGNIQIAFNDFSDYQLATKSENNYSRNYKFVGDIYSPTDANVYYKDQLGNVITQKVTIDKLDNTAPTITRANFNNNKLLIESNDIKEGLGEGSGVVKYKYLASNEKLANPILTSDNSIEFLKDEEIKIPEFYKVKYVYIVAEDLVRKYK